MEKYGVEEAEESKKANEGVTCPECGEALRDSEQTGVLICPRCGTKPFEKK
jgi:DNA-directed RNA polymerase subunit RPC12/RpoP